jgi:hypothetical protein
MSGMGFATALRTTRAQDIVDAFAVGSGTAVFQFYTGPRPSTGAAVTTQTLLGTCPLSNPVGTVSDGVLNFSAIADDPLADASGDAVWVRGLDRAGGFVADLDVTDLSGPGPIKMPSITVTAGGVIHFVSAVITEGNL